MINLIPPAGQQAVRKEYLMRVSVTYCVLFTMVTILLTVSLIPTYVLVQAQMRGFSAQGNAQTNGEDIRAIDEELQLTEAVLSELKKIPDMPDMSAIIRDIESSTPSGVSFLTFTLGYAGNALAPVLVQGIAERREDLIALKQALESNARFETAAVPIADLARERDVPFTITITLAPQDGKKNP